MLSPSDFNNAVPQFTNGDYASNPINPQYIAEPDAVDYNKGAEPLQTLPAQWWNWFINRFTNRFNKVNVYVKNIFNELAQVLSIFNITPDGTEQTPTTSQLKTVFETCYPQYVKTVTTGTAVGCIPTVGTALGTTNNNILVTDSTGKLKPSGITVGTAAGCDATLFARKTEVDALYGNVTGCALAVNGAVGTATTFARSDHVHPIPNSIIDYNDASNQIRIGWRGSSLACCEIRAFTAYGAVDGKVVLKDVEECEFKKYLGTVCAAGLVYRCGYTNSQNFNFDVALVNGITCANSTLYTAAKCRLWFGHASGELSIVDGGCAVTGIVRACCFTGQAEKAHQVYYCSAGVYLCIYSCPTISNPLGYLCNPTDYNALLTPMDSTLRDILAINDGPTCTYIQRYIGTIIPSHGCIGYMTGGCISNTKINLQTLFVY
jgi:hypothetical protein